MFARIREKIIRRKLTPMFWEFDVVILSSE